MDERLQQPLLAAYGGAVAFLVVLLVWTGQWGGGPAAREPEVPSLELGARVVATQCIACHRAQPTRAAQERSAGPAMWEVRARYLEAFPDEAAFVRAMTAFLRAPAAQTSLMPEAVARHGLMTAQPLSPVALESASLAIHAGLETPVPPWWTEPAPHPVSGEAPSP